MKIERLLFIFIVICLISISVCEIQMTITIKKLCNLEKKREENRIKAEWKRNDEEFERISGYKLDADDANEKMINDARDRQAEQMVEEMTK